MNMLLNFFLSVHIKKYWSRIWILYYLEKWIKRSRTRKKKNHFRITYYGRICQNWYLARKVNLNMQRIHYCFQTLSDEWTINTNLSGRFHMSHEDLLKFSRSVCTFLFHVYRERNLILLRLKYLSTKSFARGYSCTVKIIVLIFLREFWFLDFSIILSETGEKICLPL